MGILTRFSNVFLSFALRTVFIYTLGEQYTGVSSVFSSILNMLSFSELGISDAIISALYRPLREKDYTQIRRLMLFYKKAYRIIATFIVVAGVILLPFLKYLIKDVPDIHESIYLIFLFYIAKTAASYLLIYKETLLVADQRQYATKNIEMVWMFIRYSAEIVCLVVWKWYMAYLVIELVTTILQNYAVSRKAVQTYPEVFQPVAVPAFSKKERNGLFKDIKALSMYMISSHINNSVDNILISGAINTKTVTFFSNYTMISNQVQALVLQFFIAVTPSVGNLAAEENREKQVTVFRRLFYLGFLASNFCAVSFFVLIRPFVTLWLGEAYLLADSIAFAIAFDFFLYLLPQAATVFRTANRLFELGQYQALVSTLLNIPLSLLLITRFHIFGTVLATIISRLLTHWFEPYLLFKNVLKEPFSKFYFKYWVYILLFFSGAGLTYFLANLIRLQSMFLTLVLRAVCCLVVPNIWVIGFTFRTEEFRYVKENVQMVFRKISSRKTR